jgi:CRISP-associated protein Cas1
MIFMKGQWLGRFSGTNNGAAVLEMDAVDGYFEGRAYVFDDNMALPSTAAFVRIPADPNRCLSAATSCLYGLAEVAVLAAGYAPAIGFLHTGKPLSFVYDVADVFKFETVVPEAFRIAGQTVRGQLKEDPVGAVRRACRDVLRKTALLGRLIPSIEEMLAAGEIAPPEAPPEAQGPAFPDPEPMGDAGHRG